MFHQSVRCCNGSSPRCSLRGECRAGGADALLGRVAGAPLPDGREPVRALEATRLAVDIVVGPGSGGSPEAYGDGWSADEWAPFGSGAAPPTNPRGSTSTGVDPRVPQVNHPHTFLGLFQHMHLLFSVDRRGRHGGPRACGPCGRPGGSHRRRSRRNTRSWSVAPAEGSRPVGHTEIGDPDLDKRSHPRGRGPLPHTIRVQQHAYQKSARRRLPRTPATPLEGK
ncbi:DUF779 domain-containing protein [Streptomyces sp. NPDC053542]|uniref:DUF779 domain-containing protein n=1 Tax=Streptomyces sp. NPDC053542 TaxID=3365710 RepID=UPI0037D015F1